MQQQGGTTGGRQLRQQQDFPVLVSVALLPSRAVTEENRHEMVESEFMMSSVSRYNGSGELLSAAEYAKYLLEVACAEEWLLPICRRAESRNGVVKLCYGRGFETTVVIGNADAGAEPSRLAIGVIVNRSDATIGQIEGFPTPVPWLPPSESIWCHIVGQGQEETGKVGIFLHTREGKFMLPSLPDEVLLQRRRMIRAWPDPEDQKAVKVDRIEEIQGPQPPATRAPAPPSIPRASAATVSAASAAATSEKAAKKKKDQDKSEKKKRSSSTDEQSKEPKKKRSSLTDEQIEEPKKKRAKRDPTKPKQPTSVYNLFSHEIRSRVKEENPNATGAEVSKLISEEYKKLRDSDKEKYAPAIEADKMRYWEEMDEWNAKQESEKAEKEVAEESESSSEENEETAAEVREKPPPAKVAKKMRKGSKKPKKGANPYNMFMREQRARIMQAHPDAGMSAIATLVGESYNKLSEEEKAKYVAMSEEDKVKQAKLRTTWEAEHPSEDHSDDETKKAKKKRAKKDPNAPKRARSGYIYFSQEERPKIKAANPAATFGEMGTLLGKAYGKLSDGDKAKYADMAKKDKERYQRELEAYKEKQKGSDGNADADEAARLEEEEEEEEDDDDGSKKTAAKPTKSAAVAEARHEEEDDDGGGGSKKPDMKPTKSAAAAEPASPKPKKKAEAVAKSMPKRKRPDVDDSIKETPKKKSTHKKKKSKDEASEAASESKSTSKKKSAKKKKKKDKHRKSEGTK